MKRAGILGVLGAVLLGVPLSQWESRAGESGKYLIILQSGKESHEGLARALHALLYTKELKEHGHDVVLVFDGAGTEWAEEWTNPQSQHKLAPMYRELRRQGLTMIICDFCAAAFDARKALKERNAPLVAEYEGHPSIAKWADKGFQIVIL